MDNELKDDIIYTMSYIDDQHRLHYFYVGITDDFAKRKQAHKNNLNESYVKKCLGGAKGDVKVGLYYEMSQMDQYVFARDEVLAKGYEVKIEEYCRVLDDDVSLDTESAVGMKLMQEGHTLYQSESKLLRWQRWIDVGVAAAVKSVKQNRIKEEKQAKYDEQQLILAEIKRKRMAHKSIVKNLSDKGWKKGTKSFEASIEDFDMELGFVIETMNLEFVRSVNEDDHPSRQHQVECRRLGDDPTLLAVNVIAATGNSYKDAYERLARLLVGHWPRDNKAGMGSVDEQIDIMEWDDVYFEYGAPLCIRRAGNMVGFITQVNDKGNYMYCAIDKNGNDLLIGQRELAARMTDRYNEKRRVKARKRWEEFFENNDGFWHRGKMKFVNRKTEDGEWI